MIMPLDIRPFHEGDRARVIHLWSLAFGGDPPHNRSVEMIERKLRVQPELFLVAVLDGLTVGTVMAGYDGVRGWIHRLAVSESARRRGVGTALLRAAEARLARLGCPKVNLQVRATHASVIAFYRSAGYMVEENISMSRRLVNEGAHAPD
jgi:hypothetical protein